jgi:hypothetical protein
MNNLLGASGINYAFLNEPQYNNIANYGEENFHQTQLNNQSLNHSNRMEQMKHDTPM